MQHLTKYDHIPSFSIFFINDPAPTEIYTLSLHDALPICNRRAVGPRFRHPAAAARLGDRPDGPGGARSEEHTSELQSHVKLVCRLRLEKKKRISAAVIMPSERAAPHIRFIGL